MNKITQDDKVLIFHDWLRGIVNKVKIKTEDGSILLNESPKLSDNQAFNVIYYMQEFLNILPDKFEKCSRCGKIFDTENSGDHISEEDIEKNEEFKKSDEGKHYCETCFDRVYYYQDRKKDRFDSSDNCYEFIEKLRDVNVGSRE